VARHAKLTRSVLLELQEQRVLLIAALQQHDERPGADAAGTDDLAGEVDDLELLEQMASVLLQGGPVGPQLFADDVFDLVGVVGLLAFLRTTSPTSASPSG
jgi:hypothetical protein